MEAADTDLGKGKIRPAAATGGPARRSLAELLLGSVAILLYISEANGVSWHLLLLFHRQARAPGAGESKGMEIKTSSLLLSKQSVGWILEGTKKFQRNLHVLRHFLGDCILHDYKAFRLG